MENNQVRVPKITYDPIGTCLSSLYPCHFAFSVSLLVFVPEPPTPAHL
jgi:hypothetical protein